MLMKFKTLSLSLIALGLSASVWAKPVLVQSQQNIEEYKLENGLRVILAPNDKESKIYSNVVYFTGSLDDPQGKGGLAHLLEHLLFKGTENIQGEEFQRRLDQHTLSSNAMTSFHYTAYVNVLPAEQKNLNEIILLEAERMDKSTIKMDDVPNEIEIVKREREIRLDQPFSVVQDQILKQLYGNQSLGRAPIGDLEELKSIQLEELNTFYKTWYKPNNAAIIITGKFDKATTLQQIDQHFSPLQPAEYFPERASKYIPKFDFNKLKDRRFNVKKGSHSLAYVGYLGEENVAIQNRLSLAGSLFSIEPSGRLYQALIKDKKAIGVGGTSIGDKYYNFVLLGASYAPQHNRQEIENILIQQVQNGGMVNDDEVKRVRLATKNMIQQVENDAAAFGSMLMEYVVSSEQGWQNYFTDLQELENLTAEQINDVYQDYFRDDNRIIINIEPTPEEQKKAQQQQHNHQSLKNNQETEIAEPLKDTTEYIAEQKNYVLESKQYIDKIQQKIQQGQFANGLRYVFYPTTLKDDKVYATLSIGVGNRESLKDRAMIFSQLSSQWVRGSVSHNLQQVIDKSLEMNATINSSTSGNRLIIQISADKKHFAEYFAFVLDMLRNPAFDPEDYEINKSAALSALERPYTEPNAVADLTLTRMTELYGEGDFLYHFEPGLSKKQLQLSDLAQVKQLYDDVSMNHAHISITGEFDTQFAKKQLQNTLAQWHHTAQPYQKILSHYYAYPAQKVHILAEQREFGAYRAYMMIPVGIEHEDAIALLVLEHILGGSQLSSRLGKELREKNNLVYGFRQSISMSQVAYNHRGSWSVSANYTPSKAELVSQAVHKTINDLLQSGVTEQEVEAAKAHLLKRRVSSVKEDTNVHSMLSNQLEYKRSMHDRLQRDKQIAQVSKADVERVLKKYFKLEHLIEVMADQYGREVEFKPTQVK